MRTDALHHFGNAAATTPNLDAFAATQAVSFRHAYCQNPLCTPSRCSFLTGLYPHVYGHRTISHMLHGESSLFSELKNAGYHVWMNGRNDFLPAQEEGVFERHADVTYFGGGERPNPPVKGEESGYSHYIGELGVDKNGINYSRDDDSIDRAIEAIRSRPKDKPLCIFLGLFYPHVPYEVEQPYFGAIDRAKLPPRIPAPDNWDGFPSMLRGLHERMGMADWTEAQWNELRACYLGMVMKVDAQFGKLMDVLRDEDIFDDSAVFVFSDHGDFTGDYGVVEKCQSVLTENLTNVPLLIKPPSDRPLDAGLTDSLAELVDFYATAVDYARVKHDHTHFGRSLAGIVGDRTQTVRQFVFCETGRLRGETHCTEAGDTGAVSSGNLYYPKISLQMSDDMEQTKATMIRSDQYKYVRRLYEPDEFYDMHADPGQLHNLIGNAAYARQIAEMKDAMLTWYQETCDVVPFAADSRFSREIVLARLQCKGKKICQRAAQMLDDGALPQHVLLSLSRESGGTIDGKA